MQTRRSVGVELVTATHFIASETTEINEMRRLVDVLNRSEREAIALTNGRVRRLGEPTAMAVGSVLVHKGSVVFGRADEPDELRLRRMEQQRAARVEKAGRRVCLLAPPFRLWGQVYAYPEAKDAWVLARLPWSGFFVLADARVACDVDSRQSWFAETLVVNGALVQVACVGNPWERHEEQAAAELAAVGGPDSPGYTAER